ncbi:MAG: hypothetical protein J6A26_06695 [Oscillospiraceae bacterium]|nr:hypothetical protein [Oscillospiraceae bacterium]
MMNWNNDELMIETYLDMRMACDETLMRQLKKEGWKIQTMYRLHGERRYTMVLPERSNEGYVFTEQNAIERFRDLCSRPLYRESRPALRRVS